MFTVESLQPDRPCPRCAVGSGVVLGSGEGVQAVLSVSDGLIVTGGNRGVKLGAEDLANRNRISVSDWGRVEVDHAADGAEGGHCHTPLTRL